MSTLSWNASDKLSVFNFVSPFIISDLLLKLGYHVNIILYKSLCLYYPFLLKWLNCGPFYLLTFFCSHLNVKCSLWRLNNLSMMFNKTNKSHSWATLNMMLAELNQCWRKRRCDHLTLTLILSPNIFLFLVIQKLTLKKGPDCCHGKPMGWKPFCLPLIVS